MKKGKEIVFANMNEETSDFEVAEEERILIIGDDLASMTEFSKDYDAMECLFMGRVLNDNASYKIDKKPDMVVRSFREITKCFERIR